MPKVTENQIVCNQGENLVAYLLSKNCLVRPVSHGTDIGIDLYCEVVKEGQSICHFWVQIKSSREERKRYSPDKDKDHLGYWMRQPVPVFIFLIQVTEETSASNFAIHVIDLAEQLIEDPERTKFEADLTLSSPEDIDRFTYRHVPNVVARKYLNRGIIVEIDYTGTDEYLKTYNARGAHRFAHKILKNIGRTSSLLMRDILVAARPRAQDLEKKRHQLEKILETFRHWGNNDFHEALGRSQEEDGRFKEALESYERAQKNILEDPRVPFDHKALALIGIGTMIHQVKMKIAQKPG